MVGDTGCQSLEGGTIQTLLLSIMDFRALAKLQYLLNSVLLIHIMEQALPHAQSCWSEEMTQLESSPRDLTNACYFYDTNHRLHEEDKVSIQGWVTSAQRRKQSHGNICTQ